MASPMSSFAIPRLSTSAAPAQDQQENGKSKAIRKTSVDLDLGNNEYLRLHDIIDPPISASEVPPMKIKWQFEDQFEDLCELAGWTHSTAVRNRVQEMAVMAWRVKDLEPALLAFVQHVDFVWEDGWVLLGRKSTEDGFASVWYKVIKLPVQTKIRWAQGVDKVLLRDQGDVEYHVSFTGLFGDSFAEWREATHGYVMAVYRILEQFPSMRRTLDSTRTMVLPLSQPAELPFLPNSAWMHDGTIRLTDDVTAHANHSEAQEEEEGQSHDSTGAGPYTPKSPKQVGDSASRQMPSSGLYSSRKCRASGSANGTPTKKSQAQSCSYQQDHQ